jgi:hypothetical protein
LFSSARPALAAHEDPGAEDVGGQEGQRHRHAERHEEHDAAEQEREGFVPFHYSCIPASPECMSSPAKDEAGEFDRHQPKAIGKEIVSIQRG